MIHSSCSYNVLGCIYVHRYMYVRGRQVHYTTRLVIYTRTHSVGKQQFIWFIFNQTTSGPRIIFLLYGIHVALSTAHYSAYILWDMMWRWVRYTFGYVNIMNGASWRWWGRANRQGKGMGGRQWRAYWKLCKQKRCPMQKKKSCGAIRYVRYGTWKHFHSFFFAVYIVVLSFLYNFFFFLLLFHEYSGCYIYWCENSNHIIIFDLVVGWCVCDCVQLSLSLFIMSPVCFLLWLCVVCLSASANHWR